MIPVPSLAGILGADAQYQQLTYESLKRLSALGAASKVLIDLAAGNVTYGIKADGLGQDNRFNYDSAAGELSVPYVKTVLDPIEIDGTAFATGSILTVDSGGYVTSLGPSTTAGLALTSRGTGLAPSYVRNRYNLAAFTNVDPTGVANSTASVIAALANGAGEYYFPHGTYLLTPNSITISTAGTILRGDSYGGTIIKAAAGTAGPVFTFSAGASVLNFTGISDMQFMSADTTTQKTMVKVSDVADFFADRIVSNDNAWKGASSVGIEVYGRQSIRIRNCVLYADIPIKIGPDPNISTVSFDHSSVENSVLVVTAGLDNSGVSILTATVLTAVEFRNVAFVRGKYGIYYNDTGAGTTACQGIIISNCRSEQTNSSSGYAVYIASTVRAIQSLVIEGFVLDPGMNGVLLTNARWPLLRGVIYGGTGTFLNLSSTVNGLTIENSYRETGSTITDSSTYPTAIGLILGSNAPVYSFGSFGATGIVTAAGFSGPLTGDVSGNISGAHGYFSSYLSVGVSNPTVAPGYFKGTGGTASLSTSSGQVAYFDNDVTQGLAIGAMSGSPYGVWLQCKRATNDGSSWPLLLNPLGSKVGVGTTNPLGLFSLGEDANGSQAGVYVATELLTVAAASSSTTSANLLPAGAMVLNCSCRVTTVIPTATSFTLSSNTDGVVFTGAVSVAAGSTDPGTTHWAATTSKLSTAAQKIKLTITGSNPADNTGRVRITLSYWLPTPPTS